MDAIVARIKAYVGVIEPTFVDNDFLDFIIDDVVDRSLVIMSREQLVRDYEEDVEDYPITDKTDTTETWYEFWKSYDSYPIPPRLERPLANVVVDVHKNVTEKLTADTGVVTKIDDHGQSVSFKNEVANYLSSSDDAKVFSGTLRLLSRYTVPTVVQNY